MWCYLFVKILENEIWKFGRNLPLATFGSERVKEECVDDLAGERSNIVMKSLILRLQVLFLFIYFLYFSCLTGSF